MRGLHSTDIESLMEIALKENLINATSQFPIRCKYGYIADFAIPDKKIIIECDGEVWHKKGNSHDRKRDGYLKSKGWIILRFRGEQIKKDINSCLKIIQENLL